MPVSMPSARTFDAKSSLWAEYRITFISWCAYRHPSPCPSSSSHLITHRVAPDLGFKWQGGYGAFSVSTADVPRIRRYIERQEVHHRTGELHREYEPE